MTIDAFIKSLASYEGALTFNPWKDTDLRYEVENAPSIRKEQLHDYLSRRVGKVRRGKEDAAAKNFPAAGNFFRAVSVCMGKGSQAPPNHGKG